MKCHDTAGNINPSDYAISFSVNSAGGGIPIWLLNPPAALDNTDDMGSDDSAKTDDNSSKQLTTIADKAK